MAPEKHVLGEDGKGEVMRNFELVQLEGDNVEGESANIDADLSDVHVSLGDGKEVVRLVEKECKNAISQMLDSAESSAKILLISYNLAPKIELLVKYIGIEWELNGGSQIKWESGLGKDPVNSH